MVDKIIILNRRLKKIQEKFEALQKSGIDQEILEIYLRNKTKLSQKDVQLMLKSQEAFYNKLMKRNIIENL